MYMTSKEIMLSYYVQKFFLSLVSQQGFNRGKKPTENSFNCGKFIEKKETGSDKRDLRAERGSCCKSTYSVSLWMQHSVCGALVHRLSWTTLQPYGVRHRQPGLSSRFLTSGNPSRVTHTPDHIPFLPFKHSPLSN